MGPEGSGGSNMSSKEATMLISIFISSATSTELVPERFLRPRNFNHHPFTDVGGPPTPKPSALLAQSNPYAVLSQKKPREGREFARQDVIFYPSPHPSVLPTKKYLETNEIGGNYDDPYVNIPKNYAFSYIVRDHQSGDDFSHSQAHNGKATRGQYRVKLPDGRVQVVSYTADHKGYRADVQYEDDQSVKHAGKFLQEAQRSIPVTPTVIPSPTPKPIKYQQVPQLAQYQYVPAYTAEPSNHLASPTVVPKEYLHSTGALKFVLAQRQRQPVHYFDYINDYVPSTTAVPYTSKQQYVSSTPRYDDPYQQQLVSPTPTPYVQETYSGSHNYKVISSPAPNHVIVTPRTLLNPVAVRKSGHDAQQQHVIYKYV